MAKDPAFLFYPGDWMGGTLTLSRFLKGCYLDLLVAQFNSGPLSLEEIKTVLGPDFGTSWPILSKKFKVTEGLFFNERLEAEKSKRAEHSQKQRERVNKRWNKEGENENGINHGTYTGNTTVLPKIENENRNEDLIDNRKGSTEGKPKQPIPELDEFMGYARAVEIYTQDMDFSLQAKYEAWKDAGWKDGHGKKIVNWKSKLKNTMPYLKTTKTGSGFKPVSQFERFQNMNYER